LVTWAWLLGVRLARIFVIAWPSSGGRSRASTRASLAGVAPADSRMISDRGTSGLTSRRANSTSGRLIASSATVRSMPCLAM
jgi:hypothetical protein